MDRRHPQIGDFAYHKSGLDPRPVVAVWDTDDGDVLVKLDIMGQHTTWLRAVNYEFEEAPHA